MSVSPAATYTTSSYYDLITDSASSTKSSSTGSSNQSEESGSSSSGYTVSFSSDLSMARIQEALGLEPTGKLKLKELETVSEDREEFVSSTLAQTMESLGIDPDQEFTVYLGSENEIYISGDFAGKDELEDALNENEDFTKAFTQLTANQSILDYITELQSSVQNKSASLMDYMDSDSDLNDLLSLAAEYKSIKSSSNMMGTLLDLSTSETPYSYAYSSDTE